MRFLTLFCTILLLSCASKPENASVPTSAMVVLGFPANEDGTPSSLLKYRLDKALSVFKKEKIDRIIVTGGAVQNKYPEAEVMKKYLIQKGISEKIIITETRAKSTFGNALYSSRILKELNAQNPVIVTSEEHEERAGQMFSIFISKHRFPD